MPWLTFRTIEFLNYYLRPDMTVCEFGSGGSTVFFARSVRSVISIEHDREWHAIVQKRLQEEGITNVRSLLRPPEPATPERIAADPSDPDAYASSDHRYAGQTFCAYASAIDGFPENHFDLVLVDGRARPSCWKHAWPKLTPRGILMLDQSERQHYRRVFDLVPPGVKHQSFPGPVPFSRTFSQATAWTKTAGS